MSYTSRIQLLVVDPYPVVRAGIAYMLKDHLSIQLIGEATNGHEAIKFARRHELHVILMEIALTDRNGLDMLKHIKREFPDVAIIVFSSHREDQYAIRAIKAGASGFLSKLCTQFELTHAIEQVAAGMKFVSPELVQELANNLQQDHLGEPHKLLSDREYQTMIMIASGKSVSDIAKELSLSVKTISEYRSRILMKMKLRHNAELTHYAIKNELVE